jgi:hypothetical protein
MAPPRARRAFLLAGILLAAALPCAAEEARNILGVAHADGKYNFTDEDYLNEGADRILDLGSRVIKVFVTPTTIKDLYRFNTDWSPATTDVVELIHHQYFQELLAKPFTTFILVIPSVTGTGPAQFLDGLSREEADAEADQMYRLTKYLLTTYKGMGKTFVLQNWEGDHLLRRGLTDETPPDPVRIQGMVDWWNVRQDGMRKARQEVGSDDVEVLHGCEVNFLGRAMDGKVTATNNVVPLTHCDLYSYSSWDIAFEPGDLVRALDWLEEKAPDNRRFGSRNIYLGEYGLAKDHGVPERQRPERIRRLMEAAVGWGVRYAVYWQIYCNEALHVYTGRPTGKDLRGFWLIRPDGEKAPMWSMLASQLDAGFYRAALSSFSNQYFSVDEDGDHSVSASRWVRGGRWETFTFKDWNGGAISDGDQVSLQAHDGLYLTVGNGAGARVTAQATSADRSERFTIHKVLGTGPIKPGDSITLQARSGRYLGAEVGGKGAIRALRTVPGQSEVFRYVEP